VLRFLFTLCLLLLAAPTLDAAVSLDYGFDARPRGQNRGTLANADLTFINSPVISLSPFDSNGNGAVWDERALQLNRSAGQYGLVSPADTSGFTGSYTMEAFIRPDGLPVLDTVNTANMRCGIMRLDSGSTMLNNFFVTRDGNDLKLGALMRRRGATTYVSLYSSSTLTLGRWYHVRLQVIDPTNDAQATDAARLFLNGKLEAETSGQSFETITGFTTAYIGTVQTNTRGFAGAIDQVRLVDGLPTSTLQNEIANNRAALTRTAGLTLAGDPQSGLTLNYQASDNGTFRVLYSDDTPSPALTWKLADYLPVDSSDLTGSWTDKGDTLGQDGVAGSGDERPAPSAVKRRLYKIERVDWTETIAPSVKGILADRQGDFDPWNQVRWANWYKDGNVYYTFVIDSSLRFAKRATPWEVDLSYMPGSTPALFLISDDKSIYVNGNGVTIDARTAIARTRTLQWYYNNSINVSEYGDWAGFRYKQPYLVAAGDAGSVLHDIKLMGFNHAIDFTHEHTRQARITQNIFEFNTWAMFPRGSNALTDNNRFYAQRMGAFYGEYASFNYIFRNNEFQDNDYQGANSYGDCVLDACHDYIIENNRFLPASYPTRNYHTAISLYRNRGENGDIREWASRNHIIRNNTFQNYNLTIDVSPRDGAVNANDVSFEGRCYVDNNLITSNTFSNCIIGIKINTDRNTIDGNKFVNVEREIVLHCVFYKNVENTILNQPGTTVWLWAVLADYLPYAAYCPYQNKQERYIPKADKFFHIRTGAGAPTIADASPATRVIADTLLKGTSFNDTYTNGGTPIDMAVGDFAQHLPGDEFAVIWDGKVSKVDNTDYYTICLYDSTGLEIDRCGRSDKKWSAIATGNFLPDTGFIPTNENDEIAAVSSEPDAGGKYPIYIFRKGWRDPAVTLLPDNTIPWQDIAGGNFKSDGDVYDELVALPSGTSQSLIFLKPSDTAWQQTTTLGGIRLSSIAAGNFDGSGVDDVAGIEPASANATYPVYVYHVNSTGSYDTAAATATVPWAAIGAGDFDGTASPARDELVLSSTSPTNGHYDLQYFVAGYSNAFKRNTQDVLSKPARALAGGTFQMSAALSPYERADGFTSTDYATQLAGWGQHAAVLPASAPVSSIPLFWLNVDPAAAVRQYLRIVPILR
jgi:hypothetical protein